MNVMQEPAKTSSNTDLNKPSSIKEDADPYRKLLKREPLSTKKAVELLLSGNLRCQVCRYCLNIAFPLSELDQNMHIAGRGAMYKVAIRDMVASFHPFKVENDPNFPNKICNKCLNQVIRSYLFAQQCEQAERAIRNCFDDMYEKLEKLDPLEKTKKRGRQKLNPNHNILYTEHQKVIDYAEPIRNLINSGSVSFTKEPNMTDLECKKCWQVLPDAESLVNHDKIHPKNMWFHCRLCGKSFAKRYQMNRHLRYNHKPKSLVIADDTNDFECKECGHISSDYLLHLQHIEKHKFRTVLQHLVERNMNKLCSVCLDRSGKMVDMDKIVCLHGGYPELTGDRTMYNILGSTVPEHKSYKYQELLVSRKANFISITKRSKSNTSKETKNFGISSPFVISIENIDFQDEYLFTFSDPQILIEADILGPIDDNKETGNIDDEKSNLGDEMATVGQDQNMIQVNNRNEELMDENHNSIIESDDPENIAESLNDNDNSCNNELFDFDDGANTGSEKTSELHMEVIQFTFSKPDYIDNNIETPQADSSIVNESGEKGPTLCKKCWIFNKANCKDCIAHYSLNSNIFNEPFDVYKTNIENKPCQFCWLFKNVARCDFCKISIEEKANVSAVMESKVSVDLDTNIDQKKVKQGVIRKARLDEETEEKAQKSKWQCDICLVTNNIDRETCICCDGKQFCKDPIKIQFGLKNIFLNSIKIDEIEKFKAKYLDYDKSNKNPDKTELISREKGLIETEKMDETSSCNLEALSHNSVDSFISPIYIQSERDLKELSRPSETDIPSYCKELMDITIEDDQSSLPLTVPSIFPNPFSIPNIQPTQFQFNIGTVTKRNTRKFKKPLRRMAAAFHK